MQSAKILMLCSPYYLKWLRKMKLPILMMKSPLRSLFQKILIARPILTHKIGLDMMKKMLMTWPEIDSPIWLACTNAKMLQKIVLLKNWNCSKISRNWRNSYLSDMHYGLKFQWVLLLQDCFNIQNVIPCSCRRYCFWQGLFWRLSKRERKILHAYLLSYFPCFGHNLLHFAMLLLTQYAPKTKILSSTTYSPCFGEIYYSSVTIHCYYSLSLFTCYYSWHCSLRNFAYLKGVVPYISSKFLVCLVQDFFPRESYHLRDLLTYYNFPTIPTKLVTSSSSKAL